MHKRWVKWVALILTIAFIVTSVVSVGLSVFWDM